MMDHTLSFKIEDASQIASTRRELAAVLPVSLYSEIEAGELAIIVTELATNLLKHGGGGEILINPIQHDVGRGIEIIAIDSGRGISNLPESMQDGYSTSGTAGNGLGAVRRLASELDIYTILDKGTAVLASYTPSSYTASAQRTYEIGGINIPLRTEHVCGDDWECLANEDSLAVLVADGLGHGPEAHKASALATRIFRATKHHATTEILSDLHAGLRSTRGAAASIVQFDLVRGVLKFAGVGNVAGAVIDDAQIKRIVSHNGTLGQTLRRAQEFSYPWSENSVFVLCSDGIATTWSTNDYPALLQHHPSLIAAVLYRDFTRERDDATVVVVKHGVRQRRNVAETRLSH